MCNEMFAHLICQSSAKSKNTQHEQAVNVSKINKGYMYTSVNILLCQLCASLTLKLLNDSENSGEITNVP